jgi:hypothetical protein
LPSWLPATRNSLQCGNVLLLLLLLLLLLRAIADQQTTPGLALTSS